MWQRFQTWRGKLPYTDPLDRQQAALLQNMQLSLAIVALALIPVSLISVRAVSAQRFMDGLVLVVAVCAVLSTALLRRGKLRVSALLTALMLVAALSLMVYANGIRDSGVILFAFSLPIVIAGMLVGRRGVALAGGLSALGVATAGALEWLGAPLAGFAANPVDTPWPTAVAFAMLAGLLAVFVENMRVQVNEALMARRTRELELERVGLRLEATVRERTADLEMALGALERRAAEAERLLEENARQRSVIRALSVPVLPLDGRTLVMPLVGELDGQRLDDVQAQALEAVERFRARRLLLDITGVPLVDSHVAQGLLRTLSAARLLGAEVVLVGVRPEVAQAIVGLGLDLAAFPAYADLHSALA